MGEGDASVGRRGRHVDRRARPFSIASLGSMKSSSRISPGIGLGISSLVVEDLDLIRTFLCPHKADASLLFDSIALLQDAETAAPMSVLAKSAPLNSNGRSVDLARA